MRRLPGSAAHAVIQTFSGGYPEGSHALLAAVLAFTRDPLTTFNPVFAVMTALAAFPAYWLIRRQLTSAALAGIGAAGAAGGYLQFSYYLQGFMPQLAVTALLFGALGLGYEALAGKSLLLAGMTGITAAAAVVVYSAAVGVYLAPAGLLAVVALALGSGIPGRLRIGLPGVALGVGLVAMAPELGRTLDLAHQALGGPGGATAFTSDRGNLPGPVDPLTMLGAWIGSDYRVPYFYVRPTHIAMVAAAVLASLAVIVALWRRRFALPAVLVVVGVGGLYVASTSGIYYTAKAYQVAAFPIACAVVAGAGALTRFPWPRFALPVALIGALLLGGEAAAFKLGIGFAARGAAVTPPEFRQLEKLGQHTPRRLGVALVHDDWTKALLPDAALPYDSSFGANVAPGHDIVGFLDVDALSPASLGRLYWLVEPSLGGVSTPPSPFRLTRATPEYRLWTRAAGSPAPAPNAVPLEAKDTLGGLPLAPGQALAAPASGLLEGRALDGTLAFPVTWKLSGTAWGPWVADPRFVVPSPYGGPPARTAFELGIGGRYRVSLFGQPSSRMRIRVDGTTLPPADLSSPGVTRYQVLGTVSLVPGQHSLSLVAGGFGEVAYILAISLDRIGKPAPVAICVGGRRARLAPESPVNVRRGQRIEACDKAALLDRIAEPPPA